MWLKFEFLLTFGFFLLIVRISDVLVPTIDSKCFNKTQLEICSLKYTGSNKSLYKHAKYHMKMTIVNYKVFKLEFISNNIFPR